MSKTFDLDHRPAGIAPEEWQHRVQLAACYRVVDLLGWSEVVVNHISLRVPGSDGHFLINPYGLTYDEVTASNLVKIDGEGNKVTPSEFPVNPAGFVIHSAIHQARDDAHAVIHTHTTEGMAVAAKEHGLRHDSFYAAQLYGQVAYHDYEGLSVRLGEWVGKGPAGPRASRATSAWRRCRSSASVCAAIPAWPHGCSPRSRAKASTSR